MSEEERLREIIRRLCLSYHLADNLGDICDDLTTVAKLAEVELPADWFDPEPDENGEYANYETYSLYDDKLKPAGRP